MVWDLFRQFMLSQRAGAVIRRVTWLCLFGVGVSLAALVLVMSVMNALNMNIRKRTLAIEPHLVIEFPKGISESEIQGHPLFSDLKKSSEIKSALMETQDVILRTVDGRFRGAIARGTSWSTLQEMKQKMLDAQARSSFSDSADLRGEAVRLEKGEIWLGVDLAQSLSVFEGDYVTIVSPEGLLLPPTETPKFEKVRVSQILATNLADVDSQNLFYVRNESLTQLRNSPGRKMGLEIWLPDANEAQSQKQVWAKIYRDVKIETWQDRNSAIFFALRLEKLMIGIFLGMASLVAGLSLLTVLSLLVYQKKREIALLQVLGFTRSGVVQLFFRIGLVVSGIGIAAGVLVGGLLAFYVEKNPLNVLPDIYYDSQIPAKLDLSFVFLVALLALLFAVFSSWLSARAAAKYVPATALRIKT
jgi:lipoprotein-releasing system permease protein